LVSMFVGHCAWAEGFEVFWLFIQYIMFCEIDSLSNERLFNVDR
jgi:hypothetical protein